MISQIDYEMLGTRIKRRRGALGLTQEQLASRIEMSSNHVSNIENAHSIPSLEAVVRIAGALHTSPDSFIYGIDRAAEIEESEILAKRLVNCSRKELLIVRELVEAMISHSVS